MEGGPSESAGSRRTRAAGPPATDCPTGLPRWVFSFSRFFRSIDAESRHVARKIRVNSILPGHTNTPATHGHFAGELGVKLLAGTPLGRFGEPEDIAPVAVFLASEDSHWVTGESLRAAGGVRGVGY